MGGVGKVLLFAFFGTYIKTHKEPHMIGYNR